VVLTAVSYKGRAVALAIALLATYQGRCVCPDDPQDSNGKSCQGRHERITTAPLPLCYPHQVTNEMIDDWRRANPGGR